IAYSTARDIFLKVHLTLKADLEQQAGRAPSDKFLNLIARRTCLTPAGEHPVAEERIMQEASAQHAATDEDAADTHTATGYTQEPSDTNELNENELAVLSVLKGEAIKFDTLCARTNLSANEMQVTLALLEIKGLIERTFGDRYMRTTHD